MLSEMSIIPHAVLMEEQLGFPTVLTNTLEYPELAAATEMKPPGDTDSLPRAGASRHTHMVSERPLISK